MKKTLSRLRRAITDFEMIRPNSCVAVGVSGGKDSMLLLTALSRFRTFSDIPFTLKAISLDMGFGNMDFSILEDYCKKIDVELIIEKTNIATVVFDLKKEKNPCSLCANMRRGALNTIAKKNGCDILCLGHHSDDLAQSFLMSLLYEGRVHTFDAKTYLEKADITVVRPLIYMREKEITYAVNKNQIPVIKSTCPVNKKTSREDVKDLMRELCSDYPKADERIINACLDFIKTKPIDGENE